LVSRRERCISIIGLTAVALIALHSQVRHLFSVPDRGDPLFSMWRMAWVQHQIVAAPRHLFDANIFYPLEATLTYSDAMILPAALAWPLAWMHIHPVVAYNLVLLASFIASGVATYSLVRAFGWDEMAAWFAAVAFMLSPFRMSHFSHLELQMTMWMPLLTLALLRVFQTGKWQYVAGAAAALAAQWYSSMYYGLFLTVYSLVFALVLGASWRVGWRRITLVSAAYAIGGALMLPLTFAYVRSEPARGVRQVESVVEFSATPSDYLRPGVATPAYRHLLPRVVDAERALFPGVVPLILLAVGVWPPFSAVRVAFVVAGMIAFDGSLGLHGVFYPLLYDVAFPFPFDGSLGLHGVFYPLLYDVAFPFRSIRVPARFGMLVMFSIAILAGYGGSRLLSRVAPTRVRFGCAALLTAALMVDGWPRYDMLPMWDGPPRIYAVLPSNAVLFEFPVHPQPERFSENLPYMYFSIWHWRPMVNGYSGFNPREYASMLDGTRGFPAAAALAYLRDAGVTHVTVHCRLWERDPCEETTRQLDGDARVRLVTRTDWYGAPSSLYEIR
jgi:hypothetical protein